MRSLLLLNGSPRGARSNSMKMLTRLGEGWVAAGGAEPQVCHLAVATEFRSALAAYAEAGTVLLGMPLYTDSMPALVLSFIEALPAGGTQPTLGFLVQSGFPEAAHSRPLQRYLEKLALRLGAPCAGTIIRGHGESLQARPEPASAKLWAQLRVLGGQLARDGAFSAPELRAVAGMERFPPIAAALLQLVLTLPISQRSWTSQMRENGAYERRFATPYA
jgi:hypothetical protein